MKCAINRRGEPSPSSTLCHRTTGPSNPRSTVVGVLFPPKPCVRLSCLRQMPRSFRLWLVLPPGPCGRPSGLCLLLVWWRQVPPLETVAVGPACVKGPDPAFLVVCVVFGKLEPCGSRFAFRQTRRRLLPPPLSLYSVAGGRAGVHPPARPGLFPCAFSRPGLWQAGGRASI